MPAGVTALTGLANYTVSGSSTTTVTFSSISGSYRDLVLSINGTNSVDANLYVRFNSDSGSNYDYVLLYGNGSSVTAGSGNQTGMFFNNLARIGTAQSHFLLNIMDYAATDKFKSALIAADKSSAATERFYFRWANTAAITSITCTVASGNLVAGTTLELYGVSA